MFDYGDYSDVTVTCQGREWQLHKSVLAASSLYFEDEFGRDVHEEIRNIVLGICDADTVAVWLQFLCMGSLDQEDTFDIKSLVEAADFASKFMQQDLGIDLRSALRRKHSSWTTELVTADMKGFQTYVETILRLRHKQRSPVREDAYQHMVTVLTANADVVCMDEDMMSFLKGYSNLVFNCFADFGRNWQSGALRRDGTQRFDRHKFLGAMPAFSPQVPNSISLAR